MAKIVENGKITNVEGTVMDAHKEFMRTEGAFPMEIMRADSNRYVMVRYRTRKGERTLYIWP